MKAINYRQITIGIILLSGILFALNAYRKPVSDFGNYYYGGKFLREGKFSINIYDAWSFNGMISLEGEKGSFENFTPVPPVTAIFCVPLSFIDVKNSKLLFNLAGLFLFLFVLNASIVRTKINSVHLLIFPLLLFLPMKSNIDSGQLYFFLFALIAGGILLMEKRKRWASAVCFALAIHLKLFPAVLLVMLWCNKEYRIFSATFIFIFIIQGISMIFIPFSVMKDYFTVIVPRLMNNEINDPFATTYQSMNVFLRQVFVHDQLLNPRNIFQSVFLYRLLNSLFIFFCLWVGISFSFTRERSVKAKFAIWIFIMLLIVGYGSVYGMILFAIVMLALFAGENNIGKEKLSLMFVVALLACGIPVSYFFQLNVFLRFPRLLFLLLLFALIIFEMKPQFKWKYLVPAFVLAFLPFLLNGKQDDKSVYLLDHESAMLTGYYVDFGDTLRLSCYDRNGFETKDVNCGGYAEGSEDLSCDGHSIRENGELLFSTTANIRVPCFMDDSLIIFLSDKDRGLGMYALRKFNVKEKRIEIDHHRYTGNR
ncbi:MAG: DUF2029 domain-containing protein [Bacteroidetes bacterium]|nr:DUF2029 domain-containing protein [Bacteroidota bacterium]